MKPTFGSPDASHVGRSEGIEQSIASGLKNLSESIKKSLETATKDALQKFINIHLNGYRSMEPLDLSPSAIDGIRQFRNFHRDLGLYAIELGAKKDFFTATEAVAMATEFGKEYGVLMSTRV